MKRRENELTIPMSALYKQEQGSETAKEWKTRPQDGSQREEAVFSVQELLKTAQKERMGGQRKGWVDEGRDGWMKERMD